MEAKKSLGLSALVTALALPACSDENQAIKAAESAGWKDVTVVDTEFFFNFTCSKGEMAYNIQGKNPSGKQTLATVCCGYTTPFKGCTIRY